MQDPTPLKQAGNDITVRHLDTVALYEKAREVIEQRNGTMEMLNAAQAEGGLIDMFFAAEIQERATRFEELLVELGTIVGVECLQSGGK